MTVKEKIVDKLPQLGDLKAEPRPSESQFTIKMMIEVLVGSKIQSARFFFFSQLEENRH